MTEWRWKSKVFTLQNKWEGPQFYKGVPQQDSHWNRCCVVAVQTAFIGVGMSVWLSMLERMNFPSCALNYFDQPVGTELPVQFPSYVPNFSLPSSCHTSPSRSGSCLLRKAWRSKRRGKEVTAKRTWKPGRMNLGRRRMETTKTRSQPRRRRVRGDFVGLKHGLMLDHLPALAVVSLGFLTFVVVLAGHGKN